MHLQDADAVGHHRFRVRIEDDELVRVHDEPDIQLGGARAGLPERKPDGELADAPTFEEAFDTFVASACTVKPGLPKELVRVLARRHGIGIDENLTTASFRALFSALNRALSQAESQAA